MVRIIYAQIAIFEQITTKKDNTISATDEYQLFVIGSQKSPEKKAKKVIDVYLPGHGQPGALGIWTKSEKYPN